VPLELQVDGMRGLDEPARLFIQCLLARGAALVGNDAEHWQAVITRLT
jgi:hypothetical protein